MEAKSDEVALSPDVVAKAMTDGDGDDPGKRPTAEQIAKWLRKSAEIGNIDIHIEPEQEPTATAPNVPEGAGFQGMPMPHAWEDAPNQDAHAFHHDPNALGAPVEPPGLTPPKMEPPDSPPPKTGPGLKDMKVVPGQRPPGMPPMMPPEACKIEVDQSIDGFNARADAYGGGDAAGDGDGDGDDDGDGDGDGDGDLHGDGDGEGHPENNWHQEEPAAAHTPTPSTGAERFKCDFSPGLQTAQL